MDNNYKDVINEIMGCLNEQYDLLEGNAPLLIEEYKNYCKEMYEDFGDTDSEYIYSEEKAKALVPTAKDYIEKQRNFLEKLLEIDALFESNISRQIMHIIGDCLDDLQFIISTHDTIGSWYDAGDLIDYSKEYNIITQLSLFATVSKNIILIGANGSGKTAYATIMKGSDSDNITVIPAQKTLFYYKKNNYEDYDPAVVYQNMLSNIFESSKESFDNGFTEIVNNQFTNMIVAAKKEIIDYSFNCYLENKRPDHTVCIFEKVSKVFNSIFPDIQLVFYDDEENNNQKEICCVQNGEEHSINSLSEGEKAVLYYSLCVMFASENGFIIIDEPETYLNPSVSKILWDVLIDERPDCQFVFLTHSIDFVLSRYDSQIAWIKGFTYPDVFDIELIDENSNLPRNMLTEILGSRKPILFCEGDAKGSIDHNVYRRLLGDKYTIIPVGGCSSVIQNCKAIRDLSWLNITCKGIVDGDNVSFEKEQELNSHGIIVLPFNEIEMFLLEDSIMFATIHGAYPDDSEERIKRFKETFWEYAKNNIDRMTLEKTKRYIDDYLETQKIDSNRTLDTLKRSFETISGLDIDCIYNRFHSELESAIRQDDYNELLRVCNLKKAIVPGLTDRFLDIDYADKATQHIPEVKEELIERFFPELSKGID